MVVGVCRFVVSMPGNRSLKQKRKMLRPLIHGLRKEYQMSVAEVEQMDIPDRGVVAFAIIGNDRRVINSAIDKIVERVEVMAEVNLLEHDFEITNY
jgi:uncharacterized protein